MWFIYNFITSVIVWTILVPWHLLLIFRGRFSSDQLRQRLGIINTLPKHSSKRILFHAASAGEVSCLEPLLFALEKEDADLEAILTTGTKDGHVVAESLRQRHSSIVAVLYLPWDRTQTMASWLQKLEPDLVATVEVELWPNLFRACRELNIPLYLVSGRLYPNDVWRYRLAKHFFRDVLACAEWIGVQNEQERNRFLEIGAPSESLHVIGNLKNDVMLPNHLSTSETNYQISDDDLVIVGGSTHNPEESLLLRTFLQLRDSYSQLRLVLAPRNIRSCSSLERLIARSGLTAVQSSRIASDKKRWDVLLLDSIGILGSMYALADIVVIGGSFVNHGGHNFLEAAALGCPIIIGPHTENFHENIETFLRGSAILRLNDNGELLSALDSLLTDSTRRKQMGDDARAHCLSLQGAASKHAQCILQRLKNDTALCT
jgi:3-deoxy-D-manno-octulosonic-acid transferase